MYVGRRIYNCHARKQRTRANTNTETKTKQRHSADRGHRNTNQKQNNIERRAVNGQIDGWTVDGCYCMVWYDKWFGIDCGLSNYDEDDAELEKRFINMIEEERCNTELKKKAVRTWDGAEKTGHRGETKKERRRRRWSGSSGGKRGRSVRSSLQFETTSRHSRKEIRCGEGYDRRERWIIKKLCVGVSRARKKVTKMTGEIIWAGETDGSWDGKGHVRRELQLVKQTKNWEETNGGKREKGDGRTWKKKSKAMN